MKFSKPDKFKSLIFVKQIKVQLTLSNVQDNLQIAEFIIQTDRKLDAMKYTDHGQRHAGIVSKRAMMVARQLGFSKEEVEYAGIAGYCHDMGNFMDRKQHHYWGSLLFHQVFSNKTEDVKGLTAITQAIANHDKDVARLTNNISAALIIADKSDVHRDRVKESDADQIKKDIHKRVNYAVKQNKLEVDAQAKIITLILQLDIEITPVMDYFEIFVQRMNYCRKSAEYLSCKFRLVINDFVLL